MCLQHPGTGNLAVSWHATLHINWILQPHICQTRLAVATDCLHCRLNCQRSWIVLNIKRWEIAKNPHQIPRALKHKNFQFVVMWTGENHRQTLISLLLLQNINSRTNGVFVTIISTFFITFTKIKSLLLSSKTCMSSDQFQIIDKFLQLNPTNPASQKKRRATTNENYYQFIWRLIV